MTTVAAFWKNDSFAVRVLWEISGSCVDTKPRGTEATCIVSAKGGATPCKVAHSQCKQQNLIVVAWKRGDSNVVRTSLRTQSTTKLNQKLTKHSLKSLYTGRLHMGKIMVCPIHLGHEYPIHKSHYVLSSHFKYVWRFDMQDAVYWKIYCNVWGHLAPFDSSGSKALSQFLSGWWREPKCPQNFINESGTNLLSKPRFLANLTKLCTEWGSTNTIKTMNDKRLFKFRIYFDLCRNLSNKRRMGEGIYGSCYVLYSTHFQKLSIRLYKVNYWFLRPARILFFLVG